MDKKNFYEKINGVKPSNIKLIIADIPSHSHGQSLYYTFYKNLNRKAKRINKIKYMLSKYEAV